MMIDAHGRGASPLGPLPDFSPAADLRPRVLAARAQQLRWQRRRRYGAVAAVAVALGLALCLPQSLTAPTAVTPGDALAAGVVADQGESHTLEREWRRLAATRQAPLPSLRQVRGIDASLQAAYARGAEPRELSLLWQQRNQRLRELIARCHDTQAAAAAIRI